MRAFVPLTRDAFMLPFSAAAENNKSPILTILKDAFADVARVLEIASGTGQHAVHFAKNLPHLTWQPSDIPEHLAGLEQRIIETDLDNLFEPIGLDVRDLPWPTPDREAGDAFDGIFTANSLHIMSWAGVEAFFAGVDETLASGGTLAIYGAMKYGGAFTTPSNEAFDQSLRKKDPESGLRDFEAIDALARSIGLTLVADHAMPANNQLLVYRR